MSYNARNKDFSNTASSGVFTPMPLELWATTGFLAERNAATLPDRSTSSAGDNMSTREVVLESMGVLDLGS